MRAPRIGGLVATALLGGAMPAAPAAAQERGSRQTREFVQMAGETDAFETMEAYAALAESRDPQVIAFAQAMLRDHAQTSRTLAAATDRAGLKPPPKAIGTAQAPLLAALQSLRGQEFDRGYWRQQALAHRSALTAEQQYAATGDTPAIRQAAAAAVPMIQAHLATAERMSAAGGS